jgi:hypothetical protein
MSARSALRLLLAASASSLAFAAPARATVTISSFSLSPSTTQAGGTANHPGPDLTIDAGFSTPNGDTPRDATLSLAPGVLARLNGIPLCSPQAFGANQCPDSSHIGHGYITGTAPEFGLTLSLPIDAYLIQPQGAEAARVGLIVTFFDYPVATQTAPVSVRTTPDVGIDIPLTGLPNDLDGVPVIIDGLHLTIFGSVDGAPFTRNPTLCSPASTRLTVDSYGDSTQRASQSSFTPTGCAGLPYAPTIAGTVTKDQGDDGIAISATVTQQYGEADNRSVNIVLPFSASPRLSALSSACTNADITTCPPIGTATVTTPLLAQQLSATVVLVSHQGAVPTLAILTPQPFGIRLDAAPILSGSSVQALISNVPDIPIWSLTLNLPGGPNSLFRAGTHLCSAPQMFSAAFTAWSGASANPSSPATIAGCSSTTAAPAKQADTNHLRLALAPRSSPKRSAGQLSYSIVAHTLTVAFGTGRKLSSVAIRLPAGLRLDRHTVRVELDGHHRNAVATLTGRLLRIKFSRPGRVAIITFRVLRAPRGKLKLRIWPAA